MENWGQLNKLSRKRHQSFRIPNAQIFKAFLEIDATPFTYFSESALFYLRHHHFSLIVSD